MLHSKGRVIRLDVPRDLGLTVRKLILRVGVAELPFALTSSPLPRRLAVTLGEPPVSLRSVWRAAGRGDAMSNLALGRIVEKKAEYERILGHSAFYFFLRAARFGLVRAHLTVFLRVHLWKIRPGAALSLLVGGEGRGTAILGLSLSLAGQAYGWPLEFVNALYLYAARAGDASAMLCWVALVQCGPRTAEIPAFVDRLVRLGLISFDDQLVGVADCIRGGCGSGNALECRVFARMHGMTYAEYVLSKPESLEEKIALLTRAPHEPRVALSMGLAYMKAGRFVEAERCLCGAVDAGLADGAIMNINVKSTLKRPARERLEWMREAVRLGRWSAGGLLAAQILKMDDSAGTRAEARRILRRFAMSDGVDLLQPELLQVVVSRAAASAAWSKLGNRRCAARYARMSLLDGLSDDGPLAVMLGNLRGGESARALRLVHSFKVLAERWSVDPNFPGAVAARYQGVAQMG
jgi:hypothetical protein